MATGKSTQMHTQHPGFSSACLDVVLLAVYNEYKQCYGNTDKPLFELVDLHLGKFDEQALDLLHSTE